MSPCAVEYSPSWSGAGEEGAYVVVERVVNAGMPNAATSVVETCAADAEGVFDYSIADGDERCIRLVHRVYSSGGTEIGEPLVRDVAFGWRSSEEGEFAADCRADSLQESVLARGGTSLAYSTAWATNAASASIKAVRLSGKGGEEVSESEIFSVQADAEGSTPLHKVGAGWWRLLYQAADASGDVLLEYLTDEFKKSGGFIMSVR